ncbi:MAG: hypothetical protein NTZ90_09125 [Proteobacteria bacterium]|nr:hypothetical protein [Pseudomonadota bacterium]
MAVRADSPRWLGLDLLRLLCYICIVEFHFEVFYFGEAAPKYASASVVLQVVDQFLRVMALSGFCIAFLSSLLIAANRQPGATKLSMFAVFSLGWMLLSIGTGSPLGLSWDIFAVFFAGMTVILALEALGPWSARVLGIIGGILLWLPFWQVAPYLPPGYGIIKNILGVAPCAYEEVSEWPLLPWVGLIWFGYWLGVEVRLLQSAQRLDNLTLHVKEGGIWLLGLGASLPQLGAYSRLQIARSFSCDAYRQEPYIFWSHFVWFLAAVRLCFDPRVQRRLSGFRWCQDISQLMISRKFWLAYALQYGYAMILGRVLFAWRDAFPASFARFELPVVEVIAFTIVLQNEWMTRFAWRLLSKAQMVWLRYRQSRVDGLHRR